MLTDGIIAFIKAIFWVKGDSTLFAFTIVGKIFF